MKALVLCLYPLLKLTFEKRVPIQKCLFKKYDDRTEFGIFLLSASQCYLKTTLFKNVRKKLILITTRFCLCFVYSIKSLSWKYVLCKISCLHVRRATLLLLFFYTRKINVRSINAVLFVYDVGKKYTQTVAFYFTILFLARVHIRTNTVRKNCSPLVIYFTQESYKV